MSHAIIRGGNGRRHEVDFEDAEIRIEVYSSGETVEIVVEAVNSARTFRSPPVCAAQHSKAALFVSARCNGAAEGNARPAAS